MKPITFKITNVDIMTWHTLMPKSTFANPIKHKWDDPFKWDDAVWDDVHIDDDIIDKTVAIWLTDDDVIIADVVWLTDDDLIAAVVFWPAVVHAIKIKKADIKHIKACPHKMSHDM